MLIPFHVEKVVQAAAIVLKTEKTSRMSRLRLIKLLYISDRERIQECGLPITGDAICALQDGPVLRRTYDLIKGIDPATAQWNAHLRSDNRDVELHHDPGIGKLTRKEVVKLQEVAQRFSSNNDWEIAEYTHSFEEWKKNAPKAGSMNKISIDDLLEATGMSAAKDQLLADCANLRLADQLLSVVPVSVVRDP